MEIVSLYVHTTTNRSIYPFKTNKLKGTEVVLFSSEHARTTRELSMTK